MSNPDYDDYVDPDFPLDDYEDYDDSDFEYDDFEYDD